MEMDLKYTSNIVGHG